MADRRLLDQQIDYYRARAQEYDQWFLRQGRYDRGPDHRAQWFLEIEEIVSALLPVAHDAEVLELACGTGLWTERLASTARRVVAVDASPEVIAINRDRVGPAAMVEYEIADLFAWTPSTAFDLVFFSFWLSHVPPDRFDEFWSTVRRSLRPAGQVFFVDSLLEPASSAIDHGPVDQSGIVRRKLNDGREFDIVKIFYEPAALERRLTDSGWRGTVRQTPTFFLYGSVTADARD